MGPAETPFVDESTVGAAGWGCSERGLAGVEVPRAGEEYATIEEPVGIPPGGDPWKPVEEPVGEPVEESTAVEEHPW